jgi:hypothetical protein
MVEQLRLKERLRETFGKYVDPRVVEGLIAGPALANLASRLEGANKEYGGRILVSEATIAGASDAVEAREIDLLVTLGQTRPQSVFEIMGRKGGLTAAQLELRARFAEGLAAYRAQRWEDARRAFEAGLLAMPGDGPSTAFVKRIDGLIAAPPGEGWDGAWHLERK